MSYFNSDNTPWAPAALDDPTFTLDADAMPYDCYWGLGELFQPTIDPSQLAFNPQYVLQDSEAIPIAPIPQDDAPEAPARSIQLLCPFSIMAEKKKWFCVMEDGEICFYTEGQMERRSDLVNPANWKELGMKTSHEMVRKRKNKKYSKKARDFFSEIFFKN